MPRKPKHPHKTVAINLFQVHRDKFNSDLAKCEDILQNYMSEHVVAMNVPALLVKTELIQIAMAALKLARIS